MRPPSTMNFMERPPKRPITVKNRTGESQPHRDKYFHDPGIFLVLYWTHPRRRRNRWPLSSIKICALTAGRVIGAVPSAGCPNRKGAEQSVGAMQRREGRSCFTSTPFLAAHTTCRNTTCRQKRVWPGLAKTRPISGPFSRIARDMRPKSTDRANIVHCASRSGFRKARPDDLYEMRANWRRASMLRKSLSHYTGTLAAGSRKSPHPPTKSGLPDLVIKEMVNSGARRRGIFGKDHVPLVRQSRMRI
jgi:hypothetical protein